LTPTRHFQCRAFGRSATSPEKLNSLCNYDLRHFLSGKSLAKNRLGKIFGKIRFGASCLWYAQLRHFGKGGDIWGTRFSHHWFEIAADIPQIHFRGRDAFAHYRFIWQKPDAINGLAVIVLINRPLASISKPLSRVPIAHHLCRSTRLLTALDYPLAQSSLRIFFGSRSPFAPTGYSRFR
jgi:hypothetical protein